jgi:hypothetical protein
MFNGGKYTFLVLINGVFTKYYFSWSKRFSFRSLFFDVMMFSVPNIPLTLKATNLCAVKLQAKQDSNNF